MYKLWKWGGAMAKSTDRRQEILRIFSVSIRGVLTNLTIDYNRLQEIRLRANGPLLCIYNNEEYYISNQGELTKDEGKSWIITRKEIQETVEYMGNYSLYAYEEEVRQGFITIQGGHRIGIAGKAVVEQGHVRTLKYISFLNIRFSHEVKGCADKLMPYIADGGQVRHTLIISPPGRGKTTLLRDCIRQISDGTQFVKGQTVGVVDERSEIGGCYVGIPQNDVGKRTDLLDCCPKTEGILMLVRSMAPKVIAVDEIGTIEEAKALEVAYYTGCKILATVHGSSMEDIGNKEVFRKMLEEKRVERYVLLASTGQVGTVAAIYDEDGKEIYPC